MKLIDVTVPLDRALPTYPNNTPFSLEPIKRRARGDSSNVSTLHLSAHSGTHVDAPRHFFDDGAGADALPLEILCGRARVIEVTARRPVSPEDFARLGLSGRCRWAGVSSVPSQEYSGFDCFAMTSEVEGLPYALLEAMACERMVVAMEAPGVSEVLTDAGTGRLVAADVGAFATALAEVMAAAPEVRAEVGARARRHVQEHHEARRQIEAVCAVIRPPEP